MNKLSKIYDFEMTPPPGVWNRIVEELDALDANKTISHKLNSLEISPPVAAWNNISGQLDDQKALHIIFNKLSQLQVEPPADAWNNIQHNITQQQSPAVVVPMKKHVQVGWLKYVAAACVAGILAITGYFIFGDSADSNSSGTDNGSIAINPTNTQKVTYPNNRGDNGMAAAVRTKMGNTYTTTIEKNRELNGRYIVLMTQEGNIVRMSRKLGNMADCIAGADHSCDDQISKWQKEMATNQVASTPDNFLEILDMVSDSNTSPNKKDGM